MEPYFFTVVSYNIVSHLSFRYVASFFDNLFSLGLHMASCEFLYFIYCLFFFQFPIYKIEIRYIFTSPVQNSEIIYLLLP